MPEIKKMKKILILITMLQLASKLANAQQDAQFSQYMFNGIYINPAYAGYKEQLNVSSFYRKQWTGVVGSPQTASVAIDAIANDGNVGLALQISDDELGAQSNLSGYANYAYRLRLNADGTSRLALGLGVGIVQMGINGAKLNPNDVEVDQPVGMQTSTVPDARMGVYYSDDKFYAGISVDNLVAHSLNRNQYQFIPKPVPHYYLTAGMLLPLSEDVQLKPSFLIKDDGGGPTSLDLDAFLILGDKLWIGGGYRTAVKLYNKAYLQSDLESQNSAVAAVQIFASSSFRLGYAYDFSIGSLQGYGGGTHELSLTYYFPHRSVRMDTPRYF
jgi:type IX secretion system PorP/SprF family membrane protein